MNKEEKLIKKEDVEHLSEFIRLSLTEEEKICLTEELNNIFRYVSQISEVEVKSAMTGDMSIINVLRTDTVKTSDKAEEILSLAPDKKDDFFKVPRII
ncbi:MAG: Asp-tRNA(Asn)/Glu-tRNA(Gln) amidotransferase subunit GatC [Elusimicrobia bacterium]|jgi:aspartyl-tRNA(Asn)/glutamyl-tRNA(Gln) amidotransferase subunit C|nr:Asp-tRNA(Asn)/Glu-tRNA(Gln) amidotransferase subunit GatC [Elusimicrobiota bacterium]